jgi:hypothetical protein
MVKISLNLWAKSFSTEYAQNRLKQKRVLTSLFQINFNA